MNFSFFGLSEIDRIIGESSYIYNLKKMILSVVRNSTSALICGEPGTGKTQIAKVIYALTSRNDDKILFCHYECRKNPEKKFEDFILDFEKINSFAPRIIIFIEDIEKLSMDFQKKLCVFIKKSSNDIRFIYSSTVSLEELVDKGKFDSELFFVISTVLINTIPLHQHSEDISAIIDYYFEKFNSARNEKIGPLSEAVKQKLETNFWRGNVKELKLAIEKAFLSAGNSLLTLNDFGFVEDNQNDVSGFVHNQLSAVEYEVNGDDYSLKTAVDNFKRDYVKKILEENNWNQTKTSKILGIQRTYVIKLINDLNIKK